VHTGPPSSQTNCAPRAIRAGAERCTLHTDLANPTSNKIYASVGYRAFYDWEEYDFVPR
jgi:predicted GNAT family acetyltransferase